MQLVVAPPASVPDGRGEWHATHDSIAGSSTSLVNALPAALPWQSTQDMKRWAPWSNRLLV